MTPVACTVATMLMLLRPENDAPLLPRETAEVQQWLEEARSQTADASGDRKVSVEVVAKIQKN